MLTILTMSFFSCSKESQDLTKNNIERKTTEDEPEDEPGEETWTLWCGNIAGAEGCAYPPTSNAVYINYTSGSSTAISGMDGQCVSLFGSNYRVTVALYDYTNDVITCVQCPFFQVGPNSWIFDVSNYVPSGLVCYGFKFACTIGSGSCEILGDSELEDFTRVCFNDC